MPTSILQQLPLSGPYRLVAQRAGEIMCAADSLGYRTLEFVPQEANSTADWLRQLGLALHLPSYFGGNFDALYDCLCDSQAISSDKLLLNLPDTRALGDEGADILIAVLQAVADEWREQGRFFWAFFLEPHIELDILPNPKA